MVPPLVLIVLPLLVTLIEATETVGGVCPLMVTVASPYTPVPSCAVALTVTVPFAVAVSRPVELIDALPVSFVTDHVTAGLVTLAGSMSADICKVPPFVVIVFAPPTPVTVMVDTGTAPEAVT